MQSIQNIFMKEQKQLLDRNDLAKALSRPDILRTIITIQSFSNKNFVFIEFGTQQLMETFCQEPLRIRDFFIHFLHEQKKPRTQNMLNISFLSIPPEMPEEILTEFLKEYGDIKGHPFHPKKPTME